MSASTQRSQRAEGRSMSRRHRAAPPSPSSSAFAGYRFPPEGLRCVRAGHRAVPTGRGQRRQRRSVSSRSLNAASVPHSNAEPAHVADRSRAVIRVNATTPLRPLPSPEDCASMHSRPSGTYSEARSRTDIHGSGRLRRYPVRRVPRSPVRCGQSGSQASQGCWRPPRRAARRPQR